MSNYIMQVDIFGSKITCETDGVLLNLNDLFNAGNVTRIGEGKKVYQLASFLSAKKTNEYLKEASKQWGIPESDLLFKKGRGKYTKTMAHISIALLAAENISTAFHVRMHKTFIEGRLLEFREYGGTEFQNLNIAIDRYLGCREGKTDNRECYIQSAILIRSKILGANAKIGDWDTATVEQTHLRYEYETKLCAILELTDVDDFQHLKSIINKLK